MGFFELSRVLLVACTALADRPQEAVPSPNAPAREILVTFLESSPAGLDLARADPTSETPSAAIVSHVDSLARDLRVPLAAKRISSGGTVVIAVTTADLLNAIVMRIRQEPFVKNAQSVADTATGGGRVQVELMPGSPEAVTLERQTSDALKLVTDKLQRASGLALTGDFDASGRLVLKAELDAIVRQLLATLNKRAGIKHAQANFNYTVRQPSLR